MYLDKLFLRLLRFLEELMPLKLPRILKMQQVSPKFSAALAVGPRQLKLL